MRRKLLALSAASLVIAATPAIGGAADSPAQLAGQRVVFAFDGPTPPRDLLARISRGEASSVILFSRNITSAPQLRRLTRRLQAARPADATPLLIMVDQEGGLVRRVPGAPPASAEALGRRSTSAVRSVARRTGKRLRSLGVNVNLAPVADVARPGSVIERQDRAFSRRPKRVANYSAAYAAGLRAEGVAAAGKHFPGFGPAQRNTDEEPVSLGIAPTTLRKIDGPPWSRLIRDDIAMVMLSTVIYRRIDRRPAALSGAFATVELRRRLGFRGVAISDALDTPALASIGERRTALNAARAGTDLLIYANSYGAGVRAAETLAGAIERRPADERSARRSVGRVTALRAALASRDGLSRRAELRSRLNAAEVFVAAPW